MAPSFEGATAVITGGAGGIGRGLVRTLQARGTLVASLDLVSNGDADLAVECDVTDQRSMEAAASRVQDALGDPTFLVCAAGIVKELPFEQLRPAQWRQVVDVSLTSSYLASRSFVPGMVRRGGGAVVTMSSGWGRKGYPGGADYAAAKGGVESLTKSLAIEFADRGVRVNSVAPGPVRTAMVSGNLAFDEKRVAAIPLGRIGEVDDVVDPVLFLLSDGARYITGQVLHVNGGLLMP